jgi:hypothetical protein
MRKTARTPNPVNRSPGHNLNEGPLAYEAAVASDDVHLHTFTSPNSLVLKIHTQCRKITLQTTLYRITYSSLCFLVEFIQKW